MYICYWSFPFHLSVSIFISAFYLCTVSALCGAAFSRRFVRGAGGPRFRVAHGPAWNAVHNTGLNALEKRICCSVLAARMRH